MLVIRARRLRIWCVFGLFSLPSYAIELALQITGAQGRCGVDGFYCLFRNTGDFAFKPRWWFSSQAIDEYLRASVRRFEPEKIGVLAEAFAISGANYFCKWLDGHTCTQLINSATAYLKNPQEKAMYLKGEIRDFVLEGLRKYSD